MDGKRYKLRYLPMFEEDLAGIIDYIALRLKNPIAAENLLDEVRAAIHERTACAEAFEPYHSERDRQYPYYRIYVKNYSNIVFAIKSYVAYFFWISAMVVISIPKTAPMQIKHNPGLEDSTWNRLSTKM